MTHAAPVEIHVSAWKVGGAALLLAGLAIFVGMLGWSDVATPEAFADAVAHAQERRKFQVIEVFPNRYAFGAFLAIVVFSCAFLSVMALLVALTASRPALVLGDDSIRRILPWGTWEIGFAPGSRVTTTAGGLKIDPPARIIAASGWTRKVGAVIGIVPMTWRVCETPAEAMERYLEQHR